MAAAGIIGAGIFYLQRQQAEPEVVVENLDEAATVDPEVPITNDEIEPSNDNFEAVVITIENEPMMESAQREAIESRVISPFVDYYASGEEGTLLTLSITNNTQDTKEVYPYLASATFDTGASMGFVIKREGDSLAWWYPECMDTCPLSEEFKTKYPEIVALVER